MFVVPPLGGKHGVFTEPSREYFDSVVQKMKDRGCDGVVLGCTEIPLLVVLDECPLPSLDSTRTIHPRWYTRRASSLRFRGMDILSVPVLTG